MVRRKLKQGRNWLAVGWGWGWGLFKIAWPGKTPLNKCH